MHINFYFERKKGQSSPYSVPVLTSYSIKIRQHCRRYSVPNLLIKLLHCRLQWYVVGFFLFSAWLPCALIGHGDISHQNNIRIYLFLVCLFWNMVLWLWCRSTYGSKDMPEVQFHVWKTSKEGFGNTEGEENQHYTTASSHGKLCMLVYHFSAKHF